MSGLDEPSLQVRTTRRVAKLTTEIVPAFRFETYRRRASRLGYRPCAPAPVWRKPTTLKLLGSISHTPLRS
jgi:hypothetical protein